MKKQFIIVLLVLNFSFSFGQDKPWCGANKIYQKLLNAYPIYKTKSQQFEKYLQNASKVQNKQNLSDTIIRVVPVVVHTIHNHGSENIPDSVVYEQIQVLNEDFRKIQGTMGDGSGVDVRIEFCLATIDTNGNPTT